LITGGTLGSLAAVFAITPPQIATNQVALDLGGTGTTPTTTPTTSQPTPTASTPAAATSASASTPTKKATPTKNSTQPTKTATSPAQATTTPTKTSTPTQAPIAPTPTPTTKSVSGTFTGNLSSVGPYGGVVTQIIVASGVITDIQVLQAPGGQNQRYTDRAIPTMRQRALAAQSDQITAVSGASYTSYNFWKSLTSALTKAGLK
jgi:uncharacterized protein with FMN-binding domain